MRELPPQTAEPGDPWGWKVTLHIYGSGQRPSGEAMIEAARLAREALGADNFVGADVQPVARPPREQTAS